MKGLTLFPVSSFVVPETNEDDFKRNLFVARAKMRAAFGVHAPPALAMVKLNGTVDFPGEA